MSCTFFRALGLPDILKHIENIILQQTKVCTSNVCFQLVPLRSPQIQDDMAFSPQKCVTSQSSCNLPMLVQISARVAVSLVASSIFSETKLPARQVKNLSDTQVFAQ